MGQHLLAFYEAADHAGVLTAIAAVQDQSVFTSGDDARVPMELPFIVGEGCLSSATTLTAAQIQSPSLRSTAHIDVEPMVNAILFGHVPETIMHPMNPIPLKGDEALNFLVNSDHASAIPHYGLIWLSDGQLSKVNGEIYSVAASSAVALAAGEWVNGNLDFGQSLPVGRYAIVGMRARGTNLVAARLVGIGQAWRPGVPAINTIGDIDMTLFRYGNAGVLMEFHTNTPPSIDCLGVTDSAQSYIFDLIKLS